MTGSQVDPPATYRLADAPWEECPKLTPENPQGRGIEHTVEVVGDTVKQTLPGHPGVPHRLVRCRDCRYSWTFGVDR